MTPPPSIPMNPPPVAPGPPSPDCATACSAPGMAARSWPTSAGGPSFCRKARMMPMAFCAVAASRPVLSVIRPISSSINVSSIARHHARAAAPKSTPYPTGRVEEARRAAPTGSASCARAAPGHGWKRLRRLPMTGRTRGATMIADGKILIGKSAKPEYLTLKLANRHGLVTGATGTGKTVTLQVMAEGFSNAGVPVFAADIKGDLSGIAAAGDGKAAVRQARAGDRRRLHARPLPGRVLGSVRRTGPSDPRHRLGDGAAAAGAAVRAQRRAGGHPQHRCSGWPTTIPGR